MKFLSPGILFGVNKTTTHSPLYVGQLNDNAASVIHYLACCQVPWVSKDERLQEAQLEYTETIRETEAEAAFVVSPEDDKRLCRIIDKRLWGNLSRVRCIVFR